MDDCPLCNGAGRVQIHDPREGSSTYMDCPQCNSHAVGAALPRTSTVILEEILEELKSINTGIWQIENNTDD